MDTKLRCASHYLAATCLAASLLVNYGSGQTCDSTLSNWPNTNRPNYCCPYAGDGTSDTNSSRKCRKIEAQTDKYYIGNLNGTNPCYWTNLAGQTPDTVPVWNSPFKNYFTTIGAYSKPSSANEDHDLPKGANYAAAYYAQVRDPDGYDAVAGVPTTYQYGYAECQVAQEYFEAFNSALNRYNCEEQYSHWNCDDCRKAYARWAAAMALPACALGTNDVEGGSSCTAIKPCIRICNEVVQKCPVTLGFTCPGDNRDYSDSKYCTTLNAAETTSPLTVKDSSNVDYSASAAQATATYATDCCNPMALQNGASSISVSFLLAFLSTSLVAFFTL